MIEGVAIQPLKVIAKPEGDVLHGVRADDPVASRFGELYFSTVRPGCVKGWKQHLRMTCHLMVPIGEVLFVLIDGREGSATAGEIQEVALSPVRHARLSIPPGVWFAFAGRAASESLVVNWADCPHDPTEGRTRELSDPPAPYRFA